jgi:hypothetical protein
MLREIQMSDCRLQIADAVLRTRSRVCRSSNLVAGRCISRAARGKPWRTQSKEHGALSRDTRAAVACGLPQCDAANQEPRRHRASAPPSFRMAF